MQKYSTYRNHRLSLKAASPGSGSTPQSYKGHKLWIQSDQVQTVVAYARELGPVHEGQPQFDQEEEPGGKQEFSSLSNIVAKCCSTASSI